ncbi:MAG: 7-cyano-7-deazaguanine synthase QueC [Rickettsiales bacterium]|nr:7-cyano-7-deazaguanine synthase QueC [Rickettsiales bacterium]
MKKAIVLLSGGLDSTTVLAIAKNLGFETYALSFSYGQRHEIELESAKKVSQKLGAKEHKIAKIDLRIFGHSALTDEIAVPKDRDTSEGNAIPITYVPARNTIFLSYALAYAEVVGAFDIFIGVNAVDYSGYPDCRPDFIEAFERLADLATAAGVENHGRFKIQAPLILMSKKEIITKGIELGVDYSQTHSCYDPTVKSGEILSCGHCDSCKLRMDGFAAAGIADPLNYI